MPSPSSRRLIVLCIAAGAAIGLSTTARASSPAAWASFEAEVTAACKAASQLKAPSPAGAQIAYDDSVGLTALVLKGRYPQPHMKNRAGRELCLFDRKARRAHVVEADQLIRAPR